jgi:hypothetical protein
LGNLTYFFHAKQGKSCKRTKISRFKALFFFRWVLYRLKGRKRAYGLENGQKQDLKHKIMKQFKVELVYCGLKTTLDLRRVVAVSRPKSGKFLIYFENAVWSVNESEFENVYNAWMAL